jgi:membrane peptidoglycan carboxypeptidase
MQDSKGHVLWRHERVVRHRVVRPATSVLLREVMEDVVVHGTGEAARVPGYRIGGKTGTTRKSHILSHREYIASFAGALPMDDPRVAIYCFVDNPHGAYYASTVAAPMFRKIAEASILHLGILPSEPIETPLVAEGSVPFIGRQQTVSETIADPLYPGVPDFAGLSMAQVRQQMPPAIANVRFVGTGRVADQSPLPGERYDASTEIVLVFSTDVPSAAAFAPAAIASAQETSR